MDFLNDDFGSFEYNLGIVGGIKRPAFDCDISLEKWILEPENSRFRLNLHIFRKIGGGGLCFEIFLPHPLFFQLFLFC